MADTIGTVAASVTSSLDGVAKLVTASSYVAGLGFSAASILKFKQHKDNPTQIPVGTPAALAAVAAGLLFVPSLSSGTGTKIEDAVSGVTASGVKTAVTDAGVTASDVTAAKSAIEDKVSG